MHMQLIHVSVLKMHLIESHHTGRFQDASSGAQRGPGQSYQPWRQGYEQSGLAGCLGLQHVLLEQ